MSENYNSDAMNNIYVIIYFRGVHNDFFIHKVKQFLVFCMPVSAFHNRILTKVTAAHSEEQLCKNGKNAKNRNEN